MNIAIIGTGHIGSVLTKTLSKAGHRIFIGTRNVDQVHLLNLKTAVNTISFHTIADAVSLAEVIILAIPLSAIIETAKLIVNVNDKIILETTNAFGKEIPGYPNATIAIKKITGCKNVARCFNTIGAENLADLTFGLFKADAFTAGDSIMAKEMTRNLALDIGFENCYDLGDDNSLPLLDNLAQIWGALAYKSKIGRRSGFKILT